MKMKRFILGTMACAALCACSNDPSESGVKPTPTGDTAYLNVRINYANDTRADDGGLEYGKKEQDIKTADFYFYDEEGVFVSKANVWNGGTSNTANPTENIEFTGNSVVVLKGLEEKKVYPKYMVTVLNAPAAFEPGATLKEMEQKMAGGYKNGNGYFIMSTTSYVRTPDSAKATVPNYFVTELTIDNFETEPVSDPQNAVVVYVERLAAKVTLNFDGEGLNKVSDDVYSIKVTIAGDDNKNEEQPTKPAEGEEETATDPAVGAEEMHVHILGWGLTATANDSYMMKNIDTKWNLGWVTKNSTAYDWNDAGRYRSYWGKSYIYGDTNYAFPAGATDAETAVTNKTAKLTYISASQCTNKLGEYDYCNENTNTKAILEENFNQAATSIILYAKLTDKDDKELNLVKYRGVMYKEADFIKTVLTRLQYTGDLNAWRATTQDGETTYNQILAEDIELKYVKDGVVVLKLTDAAAATTWYAKKAEAADKADADLTNEDFDALSATKIDETLADFDSDNKATSFNGGLMYYTIPIEHLNNNEDKYAEGNYGVVRNHYYKVTVNSLIRVGQGIYNPDEAIVPGTSDPKDTYYVGATINVLSWKIVDQTVGL